MIGALARILLHATPEFAERHQHYVTGPAKPRHVLDEGGDMVGRIRPQARMNVALVDVRVEGIIAVGDVIDAGRELGSD